MVSGRAPFSELNLCALQMMTHMTACRAYHLNHQGSEKSPNDWMIYHLFYSRLDPAS